MYATIAGTVITILDNEYKGAKQKTIDLLQKCAGKKSLVSTFRIPDDGRKIPTMGEEVSVSGLVHSFGPNNMLLTVD